MKEELFCIPFKGYTVSTTKEQDHLALMVYPIICAQVSLSSQGDRFRPKLNNVEFITDDCLDDAPMFFIDSKNNVSFSNGPLLSIDNQDLSSALMSICQEIALNEMHSYQLSGVSTVGFALGTFLKSYKIKINQPKKTAEVSK